MNINNVAPLQNLENTFMKNVLKEVQSYKIDPKYKQIAGDLFNIVNNHDVKTIAGKQNIVHTIAKKQIFSTDNTITKDSMEIFLNAAEQQKSNIRLNPNRIMSSEIEQNSQSLFQRADNLLNTSQVIDDNNSNVTKKTYIQFVTRANKLQQKARVSSQYELEIAKSQENLSNKLLSHLNNQNLQQKEKQGLIQLFKKIVKNTNPFEKNNTYTQIISPRYELPIEEQIRLDELKIIKNIAKNNPVKNIDPNAKMEPRSLRYDPELNDYVKTPYNDADENFFSNITNIISSIKNRFTKKKAPNRFQQTYNNNYYDDTKARNIKKSFAGDVTDSINNQKNKKNAPKNKFQQTYNNNYYDDTTPLNTKKSFVNNFIDSIKNKKNAPKNKFQQTYNNYYKTTKTPNRFQKSYLDKELKVI